MNQVTFGDFSKAVAEAMDRIGPDEGDRDVVLSIGGKKYELEGIRERDGAVELVPGKELLVMPERALILEMVVGEPV
jgi:hypothetical protein